MIVTRKAALRAIGAAALLAGCGGPSNAVRVASKNFTEDILIAEIYAQSLERHGMVVERRLNLGSVQIVLAAMAHGDVDLYPEYTGTGLVDVLHEPPVQNPREAYERVKREFAARYDLVWLDPSPMNDSQALVTTQAIAARYGLRDLSRCAQLAPQLRFATIAEFLGRPDGLPGLRRVYGGFHFKSVRTYDTGLKYEALLHGDADVATAFTTDGQIAVDHLVVLRDDKHLWPPYNVAPVVRAAALRRHPQIAPLLDRVSPFITDAAARAMNQAVDGDKRDPADVAAAFLKEHEL